MTGEDVLCTEAHSASTNTMSMDRNPASSRQKALILRPTSPRRPRTIPLWTPLPLRGEIVREPVVSVSGKTAHMVCRVEAHPWHPQVDKAFGAALAVSLVCLCKYRVRAHVAACRGGREPLLEGAHALLLLLPCRAVVGVFVVLWRVRALRLAGRSVMEYVFPINRRIGLVTDNEALPVSKWQGWALAAWAFLDLWLRCAPYSTPEVRVSIIPQHTLW
jgi:hypothetical protein